MSSPTKQPAHIPGVYSCTLAASADGYRARCYSCNCFGPFAESEGGAVERTDERGWRQYQGFLFCPNCKRDAASIVTRRQLVHGDKFAEVLG